LMKRSCEFPWGIVDQVTLGMLMETTDVWIGHVNVACDLKGIR
jgi:hypothetical protein